ncbi:SIS domain-containing protein, partial [Salmonella enterica subsp. enterica serovar Montevideo]|nr:SIS domain-containing protein [Salmonella enterica subsp. enterica serovar Montevideo]
VIAISNSGESSEIAALIPVLKRLHVPLICITGRPESSMARAATWRLEKALLDTAIIEYATFQLSSVRKAPAGTMLIAAFSLNDPIEL